jgi:hypothetical protein
MAVASDSTFAPEGGAHHRTRRAVESYIEQLIGLLDEIDGDPDFEEDLDTTDGDTDHIGSMTVDDEPEQDDEPSLGWPESFGRRRQLSYEGQFVQALGGEAEDDGDREPWLGAIENHPNLHCYCPTRGGDQRSWGWGDRSDRESDAGDEGEPDLQDGDGEFAGGCLLGADGKPEPTTDVNPDAWVRA